MSAPSSGRGPAADSVFTTQHAIMVQGKAIHYAAAAGRLAVRDVNDSVVAHLFFTYYALQPPRDPRRTPLTFAFNGGPGASSMWLHIAAAGPRRALLGENGTGLPGADTLVDNQYTWLPYSDLVFVDPIGTGFSRAAQGVDPGRFFSVDADIKIMSQFIQAFLSRYGRWTSPLYLAGESYGTLRAAGLASVLQEKLGAVVEGIIFISSALNFQLIAFDPGNDLAAALAVPSYTATSWYHRRLGPKQNVPLDTVLHSAERWAMGEYLLGLSKGSALAPPGRERIADSLAAFCGLSRQYLAAHDLRIDPFGFSREVLSFLGRRTGILDGRVACLRGPDDFDDPAMFVVAGPLTALVNDYLRRELSYATPLDYVYLSESANGSWQWSARRAQGYADETPSLRGAMSINPRLRVLAAMGYFDLATPYLSQRYAFEHLGSDSAIVKRIAVHCYPAGHQIYTNPPSLAKLFSDVASFLRPRD